MKLFLLTLTALITGTLMACSSTPKSESGIVFEDGRTYEEIIAEPYTADQFPDEEVVFERRSDIMIPAVVSASLQSQPR